MNKNKNVEDLNDPYERMLTFLTGKRREDRKSKEKAIRFPVKLMYILQCGDYNHLIDWIEEKEDIIMTPPVIHRKEDMKKNRDDMMMNEENINKSSDDTNNTNDYPKSTAFIIYDTAAFETQVLPAIFKEGKFDSFERKLYRWGFAKQNKSTGRSTDSFLLKTCSGGTSSSSVYEHPYFCKGDYTTANRIACSGSEVKRYKQMHKDKKKHFRISRRTRTAGSSVSFKTFSSANSQDMTTSSSPAITSLKNENVFFQRPREASSTIVTLPSISLYHEDRWDALYLSVLRNSHHHTEEDEHHSSSRDALWNSPGARVTNEEEVYGSDALMGSSRFREDLVSTPTTLATRTCSNGTTSSTIQHIDELEEDGKNGEKTEQKEYLGITRLFSSNIERNDIATSSVLVESGEVGESILNDILADDILLEKLRTRYDDRQKDIEMMFVPLSTLLKKNSENVIR